MRRPAPARIVGLLALAAIAALAPPRAHALPAVLVGAATARVRNHRSHIVVTQDGERTTLALQLDVLAVPMDMAIVLPIHGEVDPDSLETLDRRLFERLDQVAAPRLEHVWEQNPCGLIYTPPPKKWSTTPEVAGYPGKPREHPRPATFAHGEYDFAVLGRMGAGELDTWLRERGFPMTDAHHAALAEHFTAGATLVVARVDRRQVHFNARGQAVLSPFRVAFVADPGWRLPLRAGIGHASGAQDVVIHGITHDRRLGLQDPPPALPADIDLTAAATARFPSVHAAVFAASRAATLRTDLVEYAARLPFDELAPEEFAALGLTGDRRDLVLSRIHLHYTPAELTEDPQLTTLAHDAERHARYLVRHPWTTKARCDAPRYGMWGPPVDGVDPDEAVPRHVRSMARAHPVTDLGPYLAADIASLGLTAAPAGCGCSEDPSRRDVGFTVLLVLALRRRRSPRM